MRPSLKIAAGLLVNFSLFANQVLAYLPEITFDAPDYQPLELINPAVPAEWNSMYGEASITANGEGFGGIGPALKIAAGSQEEAWLRKPVAWDPAQKIAFIDFRIKPAASPAGSQPGFFVNGTALAFQVSSGSTAGELWALHGNDDDLEDPPSDEKWYLTPGTFTVPQGSPVSTEWVRATLRHDYERKIWDLFVDGQLAAVNLGFEGRGANLEHLEFFGSLAGDTLIDNLSVDPSNMLFPDADKDGLPDAWEIANGSNPNLYDRDAIDPVSGKSWLDKYLDELWNVSNPGQPANGAAGTGNVGGVPPLTILGAHQPVGALKGQFAVGGDGSATYTIPLDLPKGRAGMEPKLSLNYSSNGGNGPLGVGWSLGGLQKITRGPSSLKKGDEFADGVNFDEHDRFFLDGQRLVCTAGTYGAADSEYRTEMDSFARITAVGQSDSGPESWIVETKSGVKMTLGGTADSRVQIGSHGVLSWLVNLVEDTTGENAYRVEYCGDIPDGGDPALAEDTASSRYPWRIFYTVDPADDDDTGFCSLNFVYDAGGRKDVSSGYVSGVKQEANERLQRIEVRSGSKPDPADNFLNHAYNLMYDTSEQTGRSLLYGVDKEASDGSRVPATSFQWQTLRHTDPKWVEVGHLDFNEYGNGEDSGSGMASFVSVDQTGTELHLTGNAWRSYPFSYNVTANTRMQFLFKTTAVEPKWAMIGLDENTSTANPKRLFKLVGGLYPPAATYSSSYYKYSVTPGMWQLITINVGEDYTGEMNYLALVNDDNTVNNGVGESWFKDIRVYESSQDPANVPPVIFHQELASPRMLDGNNNDLGVRIQDLNGDGLPDIAYNLLHAKTSGNGPVTLETFGQALVNTGSGFVNSPDLRLPPMLPTATMSGGGEGQFSNSQAIVPRPVDINGDGQIDYAYARNLNRDSSSTFTYEHGYMTWDGSAWVDMPGYAHDFKSTCNTSQKRFSHFEHFDLDSDGDLDVVVHPYGATLALRSGVPNDAAHNPDGNTFPLYGNSGSNPGLAYLNKFDEGLGWVIEPDWSLKAPLRIPGFNGNGGEVGRGLQDLNGDGRPDMYSALWQANKSVWINNGAGWDEKDSGNIHQIPENITNGNGDDVGTRMVDVNGDGRVDVLKALGSGSMDLQKGVHLNTGDGWLSLEGAAAPWLPEENFNTVDKRGEIQEQGSSFADLNADGLVDFVVSKPTRNTVFLNTGSGWWAERDENDNPGAYWAGGSGTSGGTAGEWRLPSPIYPNTTASTSGIRHAMLVDLNGDGVSDLIGDMKEPLPKIWINQARPERIVSFTDGFAAQIQVNEYRRLNDPTPLPYTGMRVYDKGPVAGLPAGHSAIQDSRWVVARYSEPDGRGGRRYRSQRYGDLRHDRLNETSLGFGVVEVHDEVTGGSTVTYSKREFPHAGNPERVEKFVKVTETMPHQPVPQGYRLVSRELSAYGELTAQAGIGGTVRRPVQVKSVGQKFDLNGTLMSVVVTDMPLTEDPLTTSYDSFGFVLRSTIASLNVDELSLAPEDFLDPAAFNAAADPVRTTVTETSYTHGTGAKWILGRTLTADATVSRPGFASVTKKTAYSYDGNGLLISETVEPGHELFTTTSYERDDFGNVTKTKVSANTNGSGTSEDRVKDTEYDEDGRFVVSETVPGLGTTHFHYSGTRALLIGTTDIEDRTTTHTYDVFGTKIADNFPNHTRSAEITRFASNADLPEPVRNIVNAANHSIRWARLTEASGAPPATAFIDSLGRTIVTRSPVLTSAAPLIQWQYQITLYDAKGREHLTSIPFLGETSVRNPFTEGTSEWTGIEYDALDRAIKTTHPDGSSVETKTIGTATLTIGELPSQPVAYVKVENQRDKALERWIDAEGRLVQSRDASNRITRFDHDLEGRVHEVSIDGEWQLTNAYDIRGNRILMNDLSAGESASYYNGFGELKWTRNAESEYVRTSYDGFGRVVTVTRPDDESTVNPKPDVEFTTSYRQTGPGLGLPESVSNPKGYLETYEYGANDRDFGKVVRTTKRQKTGAPTYDSETTYNALGLVLTETDAGGLKVIHQYDSLYNSYRLRTVLDDPISTPIWKAPTITRSGSQIVTTEDLAHGVVRTTKSEASNGRLKEIFTTGLGRTLQDLSYDWDVIGNLTLRDDQVAGKTETFGYDDLDRLTWSKVGNDPQTTYEYEANGNLTAKDDGTLDYYDGGASYRVHTAQLKGAGTDNRTFLYDDAGQVREDGRREYTWTAFGQLKTVEQTSAPALETFAKTGAYAPFIPGIDPAVIYSLSDALATFEFDAGGSRSKQTLRRTYADGSFQESVTRYLGSLEIEDHATWNGISGYVLNRTVQRHHLGGALYTVGPDVAFGPSFTRLAVILTDHIGSTDVIVRGEWSGTGWKLNTSSDPAMSEPRGERQSFDAWGERRDGASWDPLHVTDASNRRTSAMDYERGFTGHEMLDDFGLVHMNGRIYDPEIGRFLSPDPYVQVPEYSQNFNRYSYVLNNPLSYTDSSGHEVDGLVVAAVAIVVGIVTAGIATGAIYAAYAGTSGGLLATASATAASGFTLTWQGMALVGAVAGAFAGATSSAMTGQNIAEGALEGAITGAISGGLLHGFEAGGSLFKGWEGVSRGLTHVAGHGLLGGIRNEVMGGRFQDGFLSALAGAGAGYIPGLNSIAGAAGDGDPVGIFARSMIAGVIGGTASAVGGGKFANGAWTAGFQHLLNAEIGVIIFERPKQKGYHSIRTTDGSFYEGSTKDQFVANLNLVHEQNQTIAVLAMWGHGDSNRVSIGGGFLYGSDAGRPDRRTYSIQDTSGVKLMDITPLIRGIRVNRAYFFSCSGSDFARDFSATFENRSWGYVGKGYGLYDFGSKASTGVTEIFVNGKNPNLWLGGHFGNPNRRFHKGGDPAKDWSPPQPPTISAR